MLGLREGVLNTPEGSNVLVIAKNPDPPNFEHFHTHVPATTSHYKMLPNTPIWTLVDLSANTPTAMPITWQTLFTFGLSQKLKAGSVKIKFCQLRHNLTTIL